MILLKGKRCVEYQSSKLKEDVICQIRQRRLRHRLVLEGSKEWKRKKSILARFAEMLLSMELQQMTHALCVVGMMNGINEKTVILLLQMENGRLTMQYRHGRAGKQLNEVFLIKEVTKTNKTIY